METQTILLVDNDPAYRDAVREFLGSHGYQVLAVSTAAEALALAQQEYLDLAILDVRLRDDGDDTDCSGLTLAKQLDATLPKILVTGAPSWQVVMAALSPANETGKRLAASFLAKEEGLSPLLSAVGSLIGSPERNIRKVFLSYISEDKTLARKVQVALQNSGLDVWNADREIFPGDNWAKIRGEALEASNAMVVLLTPHAVESGELKGDIQYALGRRAFEQRLVSVVVGDAQQIPAEKIPGILRHLKMVRLSENGRSEDFAQIAVALKAA